MPSSMMQLSSSSSLMIAVLDFGHHKGGRRKTQSEWWLSWLLAYSGPQLDFFVEHPSHMRGCYGLEVVCLSRVHVLKAWSPVGWCGTFKRWGLVKGHYCLSECLFLASCLVMWSFSLIVPSFWCHPRGLFQSQANACAKPLNLVS
jgi:hypothetical protein